MTAQPALADNVFELDTSRIYKQPPQIEPENPILPDANYIPPPDAVLPPAARAKRKAKTAKAPTGKKRGRPATPKPEPIAESLAPEPTPQTIVAAPPRSPFFAKPVSTTAGWIIAAAMAALTVGAALGFWAIR